VAPEIDVDAKTERIGAGETGIASLREEGIGCEYRAMRGAGRDHDRVECRAFPIAAAARAQVNRDVVDLSGARADRCGADCQREVRHPALDNVIDLRRDAKPIGVPERAQMMNQPGAFAQRQRAPDLRALQPQLVEHRMPRQPFARGVCDDAASAAQQGQRGAFWVFNEVAERLRLFWSMRLGAQAAPRDRGDRAAMALTVERGDDVGHGQSRADDQHAMIRRDAAQGFILPGIRDESRAALQ